MAHSILVVDDIPAIGKSIAKVFERAFGADTTWVDGNTPARAYLGARVPSLVMTDLNRLDGSGVELVEHIRTTPRLRDVPIIVVSAVVFEGEHDRELFTQRIDAAFQKPVTMRTLINAAARCLGQDNADCALIKVGVESRSLDYKRTINLNDRRQRACLAKDILAFANSGGGAIVVGVDQNDAGTFTRVGVSDDVQAGFEVTRLNDAVRRYVGPSVSVECRLVELEGMTFAIIAVPALRGVLAFAQEEHADAGLFPGRIYIRNDAAQSIEVRDSVTLAAIIERIISERNPPHDEIGRRRS